MYGLPFAFVFLSRLFGTSYNYLGPLKAHKKTTDSVRFYEFLPE